MGGSFCTWVSAFVTAVGGGFFPLVQRFFCFFPLYQPALAKFEYKPWHLCCCTYLYDTAVLLQHVVGGLVDGWMVSSVGGCPVWYTSVSVFVPVGGGPVSFFGVD